MAFQPETATYDAGVLQLETTTPVQGGVGGASNTPLLQLSDRTAYLKQHVDALESSITGYAPLNSAALTGTPTAPTPALFDSSQKLAPTAFVQRALGNFANAGILSGGIALTVSSAGVFYRTNGQGYTVTLPPSGGLVAGAMVPIQCSGTGAIIVAPAGTDTIDTGPSIVTTLTLNLGEEAFFVYAGSGVWGVFGSGNLKNSYAFSNSLALPGWQRLPGGLILQWGTVGTSASAAVAVTFPVVFPSQALNFVAAASQASPYLVSFDTLTAANVNVHGWSAATGARVAFSSAWWFAIGN